MIANKVEGIYACVVQYAIIMGNYPYFIVFNNLSITRRTLSYEKLLKHINDYSFYYNCGVYRIR